MGLFSMRYFLSLSYGMCNKLTFFFSNVKGTVVLRVVVVVVVADVVGGGGGAVLLLLVPAVDVDGFVVAIFFALSPPLSIIAQKVMRINSLV